jgi:alanyl-tRNA synthetase
VFAHAVVVKQTIAVGDSVDTVVDGAVRAAVMRNHTGTHLLHAALRQVLGTHVKQAGSLNDQTKLRFDFNHFAAVADEELQEIESIVNAQVLANTPVVTLVDVPIEEAVHDLGATALFGEKYGEFVRVVRIGEFSVELCGGTHTAATGEIGLVKLVGEGAVASGVRRVEAVTGTGSLGLFRRDFDVARAASQFVGTGEVSGEALRVRVAHQEEEMKKLRRELESLRMKSASAATADAAGNAVLVKGVKVLAQRVDALDKSQMRNLVDELRGKLGSGVVVLGAAADGRVSLIVGVSKDLVGRVQAGKIVGLIAAKVGGKGGGRPDLAEAGGSDVAGLDAALASAAGVVGELLGWASSQDPLMSRWSHAMNGAPGLWGWEERESMANGATMTLEEFKKLRELQDRRVRMIFSDGQEVIATLHSVTVDLDGSRHLIYQKVEWSELPHFEAEAGVYYAPGEELVSCAAL